MNTFSAITGAVQFTCMSDDELKGVTYYQFWLVMFRLKKVISQINQSVSELDSAGGLFTSVHVDKKSGINMQDAWMVVANNTQGPLYEFKEYLKELEEDLGNAFERWEDVISEAQCA